MSVSTLDSVRRFKRKQENAKRLAEARAMRNYLDPVKYALYLREHGIAVKDDGTLYIPRKTSPSPEKQAAHQEFVQEALAEMEGK